MKNIITLLLSTLIASFSFAQPEGKPVNKDRKEQMKAKKVAFITEKLELTEEESAAFWPVYNQMEEDLHTLRTNFRKERKSDKKLEDMTDEEVDALMTKAFDFKQKELDIKKRYHVKFKQVLPVRKVAKLYHLEKEFRKHVAAKRKKGPLPPPRP